MEQKHIIFDNAEIPNSQPKQKLWVRLNQHLNPMMILVIGGLIFLSVFFLWFFTLFPSSSDLEAIAKKIMRGLIWIILLSLPVILVTMLGMILYNWIRRNRLVQMPNQMPVPLSYLENMSPSEVQAYMNSHYTVAFKEAEQSIYPSLSSLNANVHPQTVKEVVREVSAPPPVEIQTLSNKSVDLSQIQLQAEQLFFGESPNGAIWSSPDNHLFISGSTGTGKTSLLHAIIAQLWFICNVNQHYKHSVFFCSDMKGELFIWNHLFKGGVAKTAKETVTILQNLLTEIDTRGKILQQYSKEHKKVIRDKWEYEEISGNSMPQMFLVMDELNALLGERNKDVDTKLRQVLQLGRSLGITVIAAAQYITAATLSRDGTKQFNTKVVLGKYDPIATRVVTNLTPSDDEVKLLTGIRGRGIIVLPTTDLQVLQAVFVSREWLQKIIYRG